MKYRITFVLMLLTFALAAQDMERMKRDIEVGENILASLMQETFDGKQLTAPGLFMGDHNAVEGSYLEGFGILFTIAPRYLIGAVNWGEGEYEIRSHSGVAITVPRGRGRSERTGVQSGDTPEEEADAGQARFREVVQTFATDYAYLMRQVPADEKIMIRYGGQPSASGTWGVIIEGRRSQAKYSAVIAKKDLDAFQNDRISRDQLLERIEYTMEEDGAAKEDRDLALLTSIFSRLYQSDLAESDVFRLRGAPGYERIPGLGAVVQMKVGSTFPYGRDFFYNFNGIRNGNRIRIVVPEADEPLVLPPPPAKRNESGVVIEGDADVVEEKDPQAVDEAYGPFMEELKRNIVEYGSIVKDLGKDEALVFRISFFECRDCEVLPKNVEITARQATLEAYRKGNISLDKGVEQLKVSEER